MSCFFLPLIYSSENQVNTLELCLETSVSRLYSLNCQGGILLDLGFKIFKITPCTTVEIQ